ncbi:hypothetical protein CLI92_05275 [Vandammella animalimorsus]|uniref:Dystroglycan-type cadherin-like domain-containing protein n=1 Tax=Vandammella animalimorsus TaxID=2029117 RepID=A0A2A2T6T9_9BURK|nr:hypothetical protein CK626_02670 [Vandammella animalimorsus]PAX17506.1 hypothetical protein CLI92_05275 [Vandammella animalimorsus]PAX19559.1 hypothetical protein CLI93_08125 [Vandammella animalimorsus]
MPEPAQAIFLNGDFEIGTFDDWVAGHGSNPGLQGLPPFNEGAIRITPGGTRLLELIGAGVDPRAPHLVLPRQGNYSAKVNDETNGYHLNYIQQKGTIQESDRDPVDGKLHVRFSYAAVLEDPGHEPQGQPYFHVYLKDLTSGQTLYDDFAYSNQPGRVYYVTRYRGGKWVSTPFIDVDIVVPDSSLGHELEIRALGADCAHGGHGGYVYVDAFGSLAIPPQGACIHDLKARGKPGNVQLTWGDTGAASYAVYRATALQGPFVKLGETQSRYATWLDRSVAANTPYYYSVRALDTNGNEICTSGEIVGVAPEDWSPGDALNRAPYFTSAPQRSADVRNPWSYQPQVHDEDGDSLSYVLHYGPTGMTLDAATGALQWQPTSTGDFRVNLGVSDGHGHQASQAFAIRVTDSNQPPQIGNSFPGKVPAGVRLTHQVQASDPEGDALIYSIGSQATGMDISSSGLITWQDPQPGRYPVTIVVADTHGARDTQQVVVAVEAFPEFTSTPVIGASVGQPYRYQARATDRDGDPITYSVLEGPAGMVVDAASGQVQWDPTATGSFAVRLGAADPSGNTAQQRYQITVRTEPNRAPVFASTPVTHVVYPASYSYQARATDADGDHLLWSLLQAPPGMEISATGHLTWKFDNATNGRFAVRIQVDDQRGGTAVQEYQLQVGAFANSPPTIRSAPASQVRAGQTYSYTIQASDPDQDALSYALVQGPQGSASAPALTNNQLSWATADADVGVHDFQISVSDSAGNTVLQTWQIEVLPASGNRPPVIQSSPAVSAQAGSHYQYQVQASDPDGDALSYQLAQGPAGMHIDAASGLVQWPIPAGTAGRFAVAIDVSDGRAGAVRQEFAIGVGIGANRPPMIGSTPTASASAGSTWRYQVQASDPDGDSLTLSLSSSDPAITLGAGGLVEWAVPAGATGSATLEITADDGRGGAAAQIFSVVIQGAGGTSGNRAPRISSLPAVTAAQGSDWRYQVQASDPDGDPLGYQLAHAPAGMHIDANGLIQWRVPADLAGLVPVGLEVSDGQGSLARQSWDISIAGSGNRAPRITSAPPVQATAGSAWRYQVQASDPDGDPLSYRLAQAPSGMQIDAATGRIDWTPSAAHNGPQRVSLIVRDSHGAQAQQSWQVYVQLSANRPPSIGSQPVQRAQPGLTYSYQVQASDPDGDLLSYQLHTAPVGMSISATGAILWTNPTAGNHPVELRVSDPHGAWASQSWTLRVGANGQPVIHSAPVSSAQRGQPYSYQVQASDPDGDFLTYQLSGAPSGISVNASGLISGVPASIGNHTLTVTVSDGQASVQQSWTLHVSEPIVAPLAASVQIAPPVLQVGQSAAITILPSGGTPPYTLHNPAIAGRSHPFTPNDSANPSAWQASYTATTAGRYPVRATVRDSKGASISVEEAFSVAHAGDSDDPVAQITAPASSEQISVATISSPTDVVGTASDAHLARWQLLISPSGQNQWSELAQGSSSVIDAKLGHIQSQTIANGLYDIGLIATDTSGKQTSARITVAIEGAQKTAPLQLSFEDLSLDVEGLPLTVTRTYDSLKRHQSLDFGHGWSVNYQDIQIQTNGQLGRHWSFEQVGSGFNRRMCARPAGARVASVRLPGGQLEQFELRAQPECVPLLGWIGNMDIAIAFQPKSRNQSGAQLEAINHGQLRIINGALFDMGSVDTFDPSQFKLTQRDGSQYLLDKHFGIRQIKDPRGNTLDFHESGIRHSGVDGWALQFVRDAQGRISQIHGAGQTHHYQYDSAGNLISHSEPSGAQSNYRYSAQAGQAHLLTDYTDPLGRLLLKTEYDQDGRIVRQTDGQGKTIHISTDVARQRQTIKDRNGHTTVYDFDQRGNVTQITDAAGGITRYAYDANDNEIEVIDPLGRKTTRAYDQFGNITEETNPLGQTTRTAYNSAGQITRITDAAGHATVNTWDSATNDLTAITNPLGQATRLGYDPKGSLNRLTDAAGNATRYSYARISGAQRKQSETAPDGTQTNYQYDAAGQLSSTATSAVLSPGAAPTAIQMASEHDAAGRLTSQTDPEGQRSSYHYDAAGQLTQETNPLGQITRHQYNQRGDKTQTTHPSGLTDTWAYDAEGRETRACQAGLCTQTQYDSLGRAIQTTDPAGHTSATAYDAAGQITSATDALGHSTTYQYDLAGRQTQSTDPLGRSTHYRYDAAGNLTEETDPLGQITRHSYNAAHQKTATTQPSGAATHYQYSAVGQRTAQTSPEGRTTGYSYDSLGRLSQVTDAQGNATGYQYNSQGQLLAQTDAEGKTTQYGYDRAGRRVQRTLADGANEALHYNALGQLTQKTHFDGSQTTWEYGAAASGNIPNPAWGQITREHRADGSSQSRSYDSHGRHIQTSDSRDGTETRDLDLLGRVTQQSTTHSAAQLSGSSAYQSRQNYQWDANSRRTQLHTPASGNSPEHRINASWDAAGQLQSLQASSDAAANQFTHDGAGRLTHIQRSDGSSTSYQYTPDGHISQIRHQGSQGQTLAQFDYQHNRDGQRTQAVEVIHAAGSTAPTTQRTIDWTYDPAGKLTQEHIQQTQPTAQTLSIAYQYDKVGNRTSRTVTGAINQTTTYQYDANDRLTQSSDSIEGTTSYRYDRKGNLVEKANGNNKTAYSWNSDNRLIKVEHTGQNNKTIQYGYDPQGRRIKKLVTQGTSKTETHYSLDSERPYHEVVVESTRVNTQPWTHKTYVHTPGGVGELISQSDGATTKQIYADAQGTTRLIADGNTSRSYSFDAFGNWLEGDSLAADQNPPTHLYTGERYDADTGLIYLRARDYDPSTGRFISMDEHPGDQRIPLTLNKYLYANADPVNHVDPSGNFGIGGFSFGGALTSLNTLANMYTIASIGFDVATGNYAGAAEDIASELICVKFGKALCGMVKKHLGFFFKHIKVNVGNLRLGNLNPSSVDLDINMREMGIFRPPGTQAHHIVGKAYDSGKQAMALLQKHNININSPLNGVYLAGCKSGMSGAVHCGNHTKAYANYVLRELSSADAVGGRDEVLRALDRMRRELLSGEIELNTRGINP